MARANVAWADSVSHYKQRRLALVAAMDEEEWTAAARATIQSLAQATQADVTGRIASTGSQALAAVFGADAYRMQADVTPARGSTEVHINFARGADLVNPLQASGGGCVDVASFALRVAACLLSRPAARRVLVMDEPFKFLSARYRPAAAQLLVDLAAELDFQFIIVTHIPELAVGEVHTL